jgi:hypothetical protein
MGRPGPIMLWLGLSGLAVGGMALGGVAIATPVFAQGRNQPAPPASKPTFYNPDPATCQPEAIRSGFARQLQPYADQSEAVLQRLRRVQAELTIASLKRCVAKGLLDEPTAKALAAELVGTATPQAPAPSTRP